MRQPRQQASDPKGNPDRARQLSFVAKRAELQALEADLAANDKVAVADDAVADVAAT